MKNNKITVILGVHRSGTSLLTRSLRCFNFNYGERLHPSGTDNPKGFFEDVDIIELNEKILAEINFSWDSPQLLDDAKLEIIRKKFSIKAKKLILEKINKGITCFKDPRITKLIDFWVEIFESLKLDFFYILAIRNPLSVASSLHKRNSLSFEHSFLLWTEYNLSVLKKIDPKKMLIIDFDDFIKNPSKILKKISIFLKENIIKKEVIEFKEKFITKSLRHSHIKTLSIKKYDQSNLIFDIYKILKLNSGKLSPIFFKDYKDEWILNFNYQTLYISVIESYIKNNQKDEIKNLTDHLRILINKNKSLNNELHAIKSSKSWKITSFFMRLRKLLKEI